MVGILEIEDTIDFAADRQASHESYSVELTLCKAQSGFFVPGGAVRNIKNK